MLRRLFTEPVVDFSGRFDRIDRAALVPKPTRSIPIWLGGGEAAFERAARLADGFMFIGSGIDQTIENWNRLRDRVGALGRSVEHFGGDYVALSGANIGKLASELDAWRQADGTHASVVTMGSAWTPSTPTSTTSPRSQTHSTCRNPTPGTLGVDDFQRDAFVVFAFALGLDRSDATDLCG